MLQHRWPSRCDAGGSGSPHHSTLDTTPICTICAHTCRYHNAATQNGQAGATRGRFEAGCIVLRWMPVCMRDHTVDITVLQHRRRGVRRGVRGGGPSFWITIICTICGHTVDIVHGRRPKRECDAGGSGRRPRHSGWILQSLYAVIL
jgi:hypothetical protein